MKHIVFLVGEFLPFSSANGNIVYNLAIELKKNNKITILTRRNDFSLKKKDIIDNISILRINDINLMINRFLQERIQKNKNKNIKYLYKFLLFLKKVYFYLLRLFRLQSLSNYYIGKIYKKLELLNRNNKIDVIIPVSASHEEVFSSVKYKRNNKNDSLLFVYQLDRFANANSLYANRFDLVLKKNRNELLELEMLEVCDKLFLLPPIYDYYNISKFIKFKNKLIKTEHPLLINRGIVSSCFDNSNKRTINLIYSGSFDKKLRNPRYVLNFIQELSKEINIKFNIYSFGNCEDMIEEYSNSNVEIFRNFGRVSYREVCNEMLKNDLIITVGNNSDNEVPSKLFECLSFCKPIVHFYSNKNDKYLEYLSNYKFSICLESNYNILKENLNKFKEFINYINKRELNYSSIINRYYECTPNYVSNLIELEVIKGIKNEK